MSKSSLVLVVLFDDAHTMLDCRRTWRKEVCRRENVPKAMCSIELKLKT
jgi:hypothetical protein